MSEPLEVELKREELADEMLLKLEEQDKLITKLNITIANLEKIIESYEEFMKQAPLIEISGNQKQLKIRMRKLYNKQFKFDQSRGH